MGVQNQTNGQSHNGSHQQGQTNGNQFVNLLLNAGWSCGRDNTPRTFAFTGCHPQSGVSTIASEVAIAAARSGATVLIIDCNLRAPMMRRMFELGRGPGLAAALVDESRLDDAIYPTSVSGLSVMPTGRRLNLERYHRSFQDRLDDLTEQYDLVLLDMPNVRPSRRASFVFSVVDGVVLVAEPGRVNASRSRAIHRSLSNVDANMCGVVLNRFRGETR